MPGRSGHGPAARSLPHSALPVVRIWNLQDHEAPDTAGKVPGAEGVGDFWSRATHLKVAPGLLAAGAALGLYLLTSRPGQPTVLGLTQRQFAAASVRVGPPSGRAPRLDRFTDVRAAAEVHLGPGWALDRAAPLSYTDRSRKLICDPCWVFDSIPPWGLKAVSGGPRGCPCFRDSGRADRFLVALNAHSGQVVDVVGSNVGPNGGPLALSHRASCRE
jgi:hypothetical protein